MRKKDGQFGPKGLTVDYKAIGTVSIEEFTRAVIADLQALKELYNIHYVTASKIKIIPTNEYGEDVRISHPAGGRVFRIDTHHYRPSCKDYDL